MFSFMDYIITYWAQITLVLGIIVTPITYFTKRFFDSKDKKSEVKNTLFRKQKVKSITGFLNIYGELEIFYKTSVGPNIEDGHVNKHNFDMHFNKIMSRFQGSYNKLFIYLDAEELKPFEALYKAQISVHNLVTEFFVRYKTDAHFDLSDWLSKKNEKEKYARDIAEVNLRQIGKRYLLDYN